jgi:hypothetical protein
MMERRDRKRLISYVRFFVLNVLFCFCLPAFSRADAGLAGPFVAVFIDDQTEKELGPFPYDRSVYAKALVVLRQAQAKAVLIKYFMDRPKTEKGDDALAEEIKKIPVLLQARLDDGEPNSNPLLPQFECGARVFGGTQFLLAGKSGWIPLPEFEKGCAGVGFVDVASKRNVFEIPMAVKYQGRLFPSLWLSALELAFGAKAEIVLGDKMVLAGHQMPLDDKGEVLSMAPASDSLQAISFIDVLKGHFDKSLIRGKIVILGFDAKETPSLPTPRGRLRIHRFFFYSLESLYEQFQRN